jgi:hypothetical protein
MGRGAILVNDVETRRARTATHVHNEREGLPGSHLRRGRAGVEVPGSGTRVDPSSEAGEWSEGGGGRMSEGGARALRRCEK